LQQVSDAYFVYPLMRDRVSFRDRGCSGPAAPGEAHVELSSKSKILLGSFTMQDQWEGEKGKRKCAAHSESQTRVTDFVLEKMWLLTGCHNAEGASKGHQPPKREHTQNENLVHQSLSGAPPMLA
jgi:hypothetical protein